MVKLLSRCFLTLSMGLLAGVPAALGDTLSFFNTGVAQNGSMLAAGATDAHYSLIYTPSGTAAIDVATTPNGAWTGDTSSAEWISPGASGNQNWCPGFYVYQENLDLTGYNANTAQLSGEIAADDAVYIYLNLTASNSRTASPVFSSAGYSALTPFAVNSGFQSGMNTVDFVVYNQGGPTGLLVDDTRATASAQTPEPAAWVLVGTGALGLLVLARAKGRQQAEASMV